METIQITTQKRADSSNIDEILRKLGEVFTKETNKYIYSIATLQRENKLDNLLYNIPNQLDLQLKKIVELSLNDTVSIKINTTLVPVIIKTPKSKISSKKSSKIDDITFDYPVLVFDDKYKLIMVNSNGIPIKMIRLVQTKNGHVMGKYIGFYPENRINLYEDHFVNGNVNWKNYRFYIKIDETENIVKNITENEVLEILNNIIDEKKSIEYSASWIMSTLSNKSLKYSINYIKPIQSNLFKNELGNESIKILKTLESNHFGRFYYDSTSSIINDFLARGFGNFIDYFTNNKSPPESLYTKFINDEKTKKFYNNVREKRINILNKFNAYWLIFTKKSNNKRIKEIEEELIIKPQYVSDIFLKLLTKEEQQHILNEYTSKIKYLESKKANNCKHIDIYNKLVNSTNNKKTIEYLAELEKYFDNITDQSMIKCNSCKFDIICPHTIDKIKIKANNKPYDEYRSTIKKYIKYSYNCFICGEVLVSESKKYDLTTEIVHTINDELNKAIWSELSYLFNMLDYKKIIELKNIIANGANICYPYIENIKKQIISVRTATADEIKAKMKLYITIYSVAYIIYIISEQTDGEPNMMFKNLNSIKVSELIKYSSKLVYNLRNISIKYIPGITQDSIQNKIIESYKLIKGVTIKIQTSHSTIDVINDVKYDIVANYYLKALSIMYWFNNKEFKSDTIKPENYLGSTIEQIKKSGIQYSLSPIVIKVPISIEEIMSNIAQINANTKLNYKQYNCYLFECFNVIKLFIDSNIISERVFTSSFGKHNELIVTISPSFVDFYNKISKVVELGKKLSYMRDKYAVPLFNYIKMNNNRYKCKKMDITRLYDENGKLHKWNTKINGKLCCSECKMEISAIGSQNESKIFKALNRLNNIENFYRYYANKCPEGNLHDIKDSKCSKCGLKEKTDEYYEKYKKNYINDKNSVTKSQFISPNEPEKLKDISWKYNIVPITTLITKLNLEQHKFVNQGSYHGFSYEETNNKEFIPIEPDSYDDTKIYVLDARIRQLFKEYNILKNYDKLVKPPKEYTDLIDSSGFGRHRISDLKKLPDIYDDYNEKFKAIKANRKPREIVNFCIQCIANACNTILFSDSTKDNEMHKIKLAFVVNYINKLFKYDNLMAQCGYFNWSLLYPEKNKDIDIFETNEVEDYDNDKADNTDSTSSPFSLENFDVGDSDNKDDDGEVDINVDSEGVE